MPLEITIRPLTPADHDAWFVLWKQYQAFYKVDLADAVSDTTWTRFHDAGEPMHAFGAFMENRMVGIVHYIFHRSCWSIGPSVYLQDLFSSADVRGQGVGRQLIDAVVNAANAAGANRVHWLTHQSNSTARRLYDRVAEDTGFMQYRIKLDHV